MPSTQPLLTFIIDPESPHSRRLVKSLPSGLESRFEVLSPRPGDEWAAVMNTALETATGEFVCVVSADDRLRADALEVLTHWLTDGTDMLYSDQIENDRIIRKPVFSPERLRGQNYLGSLVILRRTLVNEVGGFSLDVPGAEKYDLILRASREARDVAHVPEALIAIGNVSNLDEPRESRELDSLKVAVQRHLGHTGGGEILSISSTFVDSRRQVVGRPLVSIVVPTRGDSAVVHGEERQLVVEALRSVIDRSTYSNIEFVVVFDTSTPASVLEELRALVPDTDRLRLIEWTAPFSFSGKMNLGVVHARGEFVLFLNDDTELLSNEWIESMLALAQRPTAGIVGAYLLFEDDTIQHAGHAYYHYGVTHVGLNSPVGSGGPGDALLVEREVDGVTAACALMRRDVFFEVGGFSVLLPGNFNDVDLCLKLASKGYSAYVTPHALLYHFESKTRDPTVAASEIEVTWGRWEHVLGESAFWPQPPDALYEADLVEPDWRA